MRDTTTIKITFFLIRHGFTKSNSERRYLGCGNDEALLEDEKYNLQCDYFENTDFDFVYISPMKRCRQTLDIIYPREIQAEVVDEFREINFGVFEGNTYDDLKENADYIRWLDSAGLCAPPLGESREEFVQRTMLGYERVISQMCSVQDKTKQINALAVVHGGTIMAVMSSLLDRDYYDFQVSCGEGVKIDLEIRKNECDITYSRICIRRNS